MGTAKTLLGTAVAIAAREHEHQADRGGAAYIMHPIRVMMRLRTSDEELMAIAILHDVVEDSTAVTIASLKDAGFPQRVLDALGLLTHDKSEPYEEYVKRVATNRDAARVKLEDLRDNSDITRLKGLRDKDFERMEKYHRAFLYLRSALETMDKVGYR